MSPKYSLILLNKIRSKQYAKMIQEWGQLQIRTDFLSPPTFVMRMCISDRLTSREFLTCQNFQDDADSLQLSDTLSKSEFLCRAWVSRVIGVEGPGYKTVMVCRPWVTITTNCTIALLRNDIKQHTRMYIVE